MTDDEIVRSLLGAMDKHLQLHSQREFFTFLQTRVAAESFVVHQCGWAIHQNLDKLGLSDYRVAFEKPRRADLVLVPMKADGSEVEDDSFVFEFKIAWPGSPKAEGKDAQILADLLKWNHRKRVFAVAFLFRFENAPDWSCYRFNQISIERIQEMISSSVGFAPFWEGTAFDLGTDEAKGIGKLVAWRLPG